MYISKKFRFWPGGAAHHTPRFLARRAKPPQTAPLNGRPRSNAFFFGTVDDTGTADDRPTTRSKVYLRRLQNAVI